MSFIGKYKAFLIAVALFMISLPGTAFAYSVSGLVEFSYRDYETKIGQQQTSWSEFVQNYRVSADTFVYDPRFLIVRGGVGYAINSRSGGEKTNTLSYDLTTFFFPRNAI